MKKIILAIGVFGFSLAALAVPRQMYLASPSKIAVSGKNVNLTLQLACQNVNVDESAGNLVAVHDDEGDNAVALGVVLSKSNCMPGELKSVVLTYDLKQTGLSAEDLKNGATLIPMDLAK
jgi:hypothetical protein